MKSLTAVIAALAVNVALTVMKATVAALTGRAAMHAEAWHSAADTGNQLLLYVGSALSERPPDRRHPFGHVRDAYFWAFVVAVLLFAVGGTVGLHEAIRKLLPGGESEAPWYAFAVLGGAFVFESMSFMVGARAFRALPISESLPRYLIDARDPALLTVLLEDAIALLSILVAATGLLAQRLTGDPIWDAAASGVVGATLVAAAAVLSFKNYSLLLGEPARPETESRVRHAIEDDPAVARVLDLRTLHLGPRAIVVAARVHFRDELTARDIGKAVERIEERVERALQGATSRHHVVIEPALPGTDDPRRAA